MDAIEYAEWQAHNERISSKYIQALTPCHDCLAGYAADMRAIGRCDGIPGEPLVEVPPPARTRSHEQYYAEKHARMLESIERANELLDTGMTQTAVAKVMGVSPSAVSKWSRAREAA